MTVGELSTVRFQPSGRFLKRVVELQILADLPKVRQEFLTDEIETPHRILVAIELGRREPGGAPPFILTAATCMIKKAGSARPDWPCDCLASVCAIF